MRRLRPLDYLIFIAFLAVIAVSVSSFWFRTPGEFVQIETPSETIVLPLLEDKVLEVQGDCGAMKVQISEKSVRVLESQCPNEICLHFGSIRRNGEIIVCVPNKVSIKIIAEGNEGEQAPDAITR